MSTSLRILVVSQYFWPEDFRVNELVRELSAGGHKVTVLTGRPNYPSGSIYPEYVRGRQDFSNYFGAEVLRVPLRPRKSGKFNLALNYWSFVFWGSLLSPWLLRGKELDAIFVFETSPITAAIPAILLKKLKRVPLTMWVLDLWPDTVRALGVVRNARHYALAGRLVQAIYGQCDLILTQSRSFSKSIAVWNKRDRPVRYFPQWVEDVYLARTTKVAAEMAQFRKKFVVLFAGNIGEGQDFPAIVDAADRLRDHLDIMWVVVGDGRFAPWVREELDRRGLNDTVKLLGRFPAERMPEFFNAASALLVSLKSEDVFSMTIPGKVQSYLAAGKPVLGMLDGEGATVVREAGAGLVCKAGDAVSLAANVLELKAKTPSELEALGQSGRRYALKWFGKDALIKEFVEMLPVAGEERKPAVTAH